MIKSDHLAQVGWVLMNALNKIQLQYPEKKKSNKHLKHYQHATRTKKILKIN